MDSTPENPVPRRSYRAVVLVRVDDPIAMKTVTQATIEVEFDAGDDPREMLVRRAVEHAAAQAQTAERWSWY